MVCFDSKICRETGVLAPVEDLQRTGRDVKNTKSLINSTLVSCSWHNWQYLDVLQFVFSRDEKVSSSPNRWGWCRSALSGLKLSVKRERPAHLKERRNRFRSNVWSVHLPGLPGCCNEAIVGCGSVPRTHNTQNSSYSRTNNLILNITVCSGVTTQIQIKWTLYGIPRLGQVHCQLVFNSYFYHLNIRQ